MESKKIVIKTGGFSTLLAVLFIVLKLTGQIGWSWIWVLSPLWIPTAICLLIIGIFFAFFGGLMLLGAYFRNKGL